jgi:hypothetical protein
MYSQTEDDEEDDDTDVLHIFGRTHNTPPTYYYRQLVKGTLWTPWKKVNLDIQSDHLIPVVHNRRLYLFWPLFDEKSVDTGKSVPPFVESKEHWYWLQKHENWKRQHQAWQTLNDLWKSMQSLDQLINNDDDEDTNSNFANAFIRRYNADPWPVLKRFDPNDEPREPSAPQDSSDPNFSRWEIKLAWSESSGIWSQSKPPQHSGLPVCHQDG